MQAVNPKHITEKCLIAADVDKTILAQSETEESEFFRRVAPCLVEAARLGAKLAFVTGNSMSELTTRFLKWLLSHLCFTDSLDLLDQFHFFCNSGGVYVHFPSKDRAISSILSQCPSHQRNVADKIYEILTFEDEHGNRLIRTRFVDPSYIKRTQISRAEIRKIISILDTCSKTYLQELKAHRTTYEKSYDIEKISGNRELKTPKVDARGVRYGSESSPSEATVQITLKPILSFRHGKTKKKRVELFEKDLRTWLIGEIQKRLDELGLDYYVPRAGGRSSIDITQEKLDKAYALEFLIDRLNLQGHPRLGQKFGSNTVYFGDEVIVGGGNDYPVTRIPGLLVFAVNPDKELIPFLSQVFAPSSIMEGPGATAEVLSEFNKIAHNLIAGQKFKNIARSHSLYPFSALDTLKIEVFAERIREKTESLKTRGTASPEDWQTLHAFVTLMHREDQAARQWLSILINELDAIMTQIAENPRPSQAGIGTSHPDN